MKRWTIALVLLLFVAGTAQAARPDKFSGRMVTEATGGKEGKVMTSSSLVFMLKGNSRTEMDMGPMKMKVIHREDQKKTYMINPEKKIYSVQATDEKERNVNYLKEDPSIQREKLGEEKIDGEPTTKWKNTRKDAASGKTELFLTWESEKFGGMPLQIETTQEGRTVRMKFTEINQREVTSDMFEIPSDWKQASANEVMGMPAMPGMPGGGMPMMPHKPPQTH